MSEPSGAGNLPVPAAPAPVPGAVTSASPPSGELVPVSRPLPDRRVVTTAKGKQFVAVPRKPRRAWTNRMAVIFAVVAVLIAGGVVTLYATHGQPAATTPADVGTPDTAVRAFLSAVFLGDDASRLASVVCSTWTPTDALIRTKSMVAADAKVSWDDLRVITTESDRVTMTARLGLRLPDDVQPSVYQQWHFTVVKEQGWRVCDASPVAS